MKSFNFISLTTIHPDLTGTLVVGDGSWVWFHSDPYSGSLAVRSSKRRKKVVQRPQSLHPRSPKRH
ncbi:hypothetical protein AB4Z52_17845 [Rhizobium sp. 2YAF20]|uniref:hypothetical protein n=1 Tax=Rhizobium sp. 2YAF20 TaxID=3233027 RepID=UPI003F9D042E